MPSPLSALYQSNHPQADLTRLKRLQQRTSEPSILQQIQQLHHHLNAQTQSATHPRKTASDTHR